MERSASTSRGWPVPLEDGTIDFEANKASRRWKPRGGPSLPPADVGHVGRHDGYELDVRVQRQVRHVHDR